MSLFFPSLCISCERSIKDFQHKYICTDCHGTIKTIQEKSCNICGKPMIADIDECRECREMKRYFTDVTPAGIYEGVLKDAIHCVKFDRKSKMSKVLAELIRKNENHIIENDEIVVPVPLSKQALVDRGYNQTELMAKALGYEIVRAVAKIKETTPQNKLTKKERAKNLKGAFSVVKDVSGKKVVVLDDVYTTGSTMNEMAKVLVEAGAVSVRGVVAARSV